MKDKESVIRGIIATVLVLGALGFVVTLFVPETRSLLKDPVAAGTFGVMLGLWFKDMAAPINYYFSGTKASNEANAKIADFATSPGSVSSDAASTTNIINQTNTAAGDAQ